MNNNIILPDTSLCSIVRDEMMNPAGGIERFIDSHVPYVEEAIIADTGSVDGTREKLEELQGKYSNLKVFDIPFYGYADARNRSLKFVKTKRALLLDADELLTHEKPQNDWLILKEFIEMQKSKVYSFDILAIPFNKKEYIQDDANFKRLFNTKSMLFSGILGEKLNYLGIYYQPLDVRIKHFIPSSESAEKKKDSWYLLSKEKNFSEDPILELKRLSLWKNAPSKIDGFKEWKQYNPKREDYI